MWRSPVGAGFSAISMVGDRLYTMDSDEKTEYALCLDAESGRMIWRVPVGPIFKDVNGDGPRSAPTMDGDVVFVMGSRGHLSGTGRGRGEVVWQVETRKPSIASCLYGHSVPHRSSKVIMLIVEVGGSGARAVAAFDKGTGEVRWTARKPT